MHKKPNSIFIISLLLLQLYPLSVCLAQNGNSAAGVFYLIAHRGGVVEGKHAENSLPAMEAAYKRGYKMIEVDLRLTKDSVLIIQHDNNFKRYFNLDRSVGDMTWAEINELRSNTGSKVLSLEEVLQYCRGKMDLMLDNKIAGNDTLIWNKLITLLNRYQFNHNTLMIGTDESTGFFVGKIKLSCTRKQLEENMQKPGYHPNHYYLFSNELTQADIRWAQQNGILAIGVLNNWRFRNAPQPKEEAAQYANRWKTAGLTHFQLDSEFDFLFLKPTQKKR